MHCVVLVVLLATIQSATAGSKLPSTGRVVWYIPDAMHLIRTADEVYICPVTLTDKDGEVTPHGNYKHLRRLDADARRKLGRLLGNERNWFHGSDNRITVGYERRNVGFIFRRGGDELVLLCGLVNSLEGRFNREHTSGDLEDKASEKLDEWKKQYAKSELATK